MSETHIEPPAPPPGGPPPPAPPPAAEATWPEDWRDRFVKKAPAADREKLAKRLNRFASPDNLLGSYLELDRQVGAGVLKRTLPENASPEEVAAYRKEHGIPAEATIEAYGIKFPEGVEPSDAVKADLGEFLGEMHKLNVPPNTVQAVWNQYLAVQNKATQQLAEAAQAATVERKAEIRAEYGREYERNLRVGNAFLAEHLGEEKAAELAQTILADGTRLGDHPDFVRLFVKAALANADDAAIVTAETGAGASIEEAYKAAINLEYEDYEKWKTPEHQARLARLSAAVKKKAA